MGRYIITLYDKDFDVIKEMLVKVENRDVATKMANKMIPRKVNAKICAAQARTLHTYGLHKFYEKD